ncbi:ribokinase [Flexithrix dorotheae]|uniref:ribokinase n=1 Tax=Flexithrix dorotheae TaxID=70993 RepID=UPI00035C2F37|nr:ribokinase [Flexithrix dorotheae]
MKKSKITVIGSSNTDMVVQSSKLPAPGETVLGGKFIMNPGGKGANQAVAASKLGGEVTFIAKLGNDIFGREAIHGFDKEGIHTKYISTHEDQPSGVALIMVDDHGENSISVALGANATLNTEDIDKGLEVISNSDYVLMQLEIPIKAVNYAAKKASENGVKVVLNPAPAQSLSDELLGNLHIITPNETEAQLLTGVKVTDVNSAQKAAEILKSKGVEMVIITLGSKGAYVFTDEFKGLIIAPKVTPIDTTAAGDTFNGALVVALGEGMNIQEAVEFSNKAAAISVTRLGAQASTPYREEL